MIKGLNIFNFTPFISFIGGCVYRVYHRACLKFLRASGQIYESQFYGAEFKDIF